MSKSHKVFVAIVALLLFAIVAPANAQQSAAPLAQATVEPTAAATNTPDAAEATPAVLPETGASETSGQLPGLVIAMLIAMGAAFVLAGISVYMLAQRPR